MRIGVFIENQRTGQGGGDIESFVARCRQVAGSGFRSIWTSQIFGLDALTAIAVAGREVPDVEFGTAVVPTYPRHPMMLAAQARTAQFATGNRLTLGIGLSHQPVIEGMYGYSFEKPARHMREYLSALLPLVREGRVQFQGETVRAFGELRIAETSPLPVVIAGLGPRMLQLAGALADGTVTWMTGPRTVASHITPRITEAAIAAERPEPRVIVCLPVAVTDDPDGARAKAARAFAVYGQLPSYRAMLDREGAGGPADVAIVGDEETVAKAIAEVDQAGATEFVAVPFDQEQRTFDLLRTLA